MRNKGPASLVDFQELNQSRNHADIAITTTTQHSFHLSNETFDFSSCKLQTNAISELYDVERLQEADNPRLLQMLAQVATH